MYGFQVGPVILGIILGPLIDVSYRRAMISAGDEPLAFLGEFFTSPISAILRRGAGADGAEPDDAVGRLTGDRSGLTPRRAGD